MLCSSQLSLYSRALSVAAERNNVNPAPPFSRKDVNRISGMTTFDTDSVIAWIHEWVYHWLVFIRINRKPGICDLRISAIDTTQNTHLLWLLHSFGMPPRMPHNWFT
jgi:hypothetical protein